MAQDTFGQTWNKLLLYVPDLDPALAREFVLQAYRSVLNAHYWSELRKDDEIYVPSEYTTGTVDVTQNSAIISGNGTAWTAAMQFRQIALGNRAPWYTIISVDNPTQITVDKVYEAEDATAVSYAIGQYYLEFPTDLEVFEDIRDRENAWRITTHYYNQEYLDRIDSARLSTGTPVCIVPASPRTDSSGNVIPRYELWPRTSDKNYVFRYYRRHTVTSNSDRFIDAIDPEVVLYGALHLAALYPGTVSAPNPQFSMELHKSYSQLYEEKLRDAIVADHDRAQLMIDYNDAGLRYPADAKFFQRHPL